MSASRRYWSFLMKSYISMHVKKNTKTTKDESTFFFEKLRVFLFFDSQACGMPYCFLFTIYCTVSSRKIGQFVFFLASNHDGSNVVQSFRCDAKMNRWCNGNGLNKRRQSMIKRVFKLHFDIFAHIYIY